MTNVIKKESKTFILVVRMKLIESSICDYAVIGYL